MRLARWILFAALASILRGLAWVPFVTADALRSVAAECERRAEGLY